MIPYSKSTWILISWALFVIGFGGFTRLMDAGLGCPDWPACYGQWIVEHHLVDSVSSHAYLEAWIEMLHRYAAGLLGLGIGLRIISLIHAQRIFLALCLLLALGFQAALGMWTVTLKLNPIIVSSHFFGAMLLIRLIAQSDSKHSHSYRSENKVQGNLDYLGMTYLLQLILGLLVSTNYAALSCSYPFFCPSASFGSFTSALSSLPQQFYDHSPLSWFSLPEKASLQWAHHINALLVLFFAWKTRQNIYMQYPKSYSPKIYSDLVILCILFQIGLGSSLIFLQLPIVLAVIHNLIAALIGTLVILLRLSFHSQHKDTYEISMA